MRCGQVQLQNVMGSLEAATRHRDPLPAIGFLGKDRPGYTPNHSSTPSAAASPTPLMSPNAMYAGQPMPFSYAPAATTPLQPGYISPPESRRVIEDDKEKQAAPRQSLPSIHEALGNDNPLPYPPPTSAPPSQPGHTAPPSHLIGRSGAEGPPGPPNPFSNGPSSGSLMREPAFPPQSQLQPEASRSSLASINTQESRNPSLSTGKSPTQSAKTGVSSVSGSQNSSYEYSAPTSAGSVASPNGYSHFHPNYSFQSQPPPSVPTYPPAPHDNRPFLGGPWKPGTDLPRVERPIPGQPHSDSTKRHLDVYDVETSLNEIAEMSTRTLDFSRHYAAKAHQTQRSGPVLGSLPSLTEVEDMLHVQRRNQDALIRIRTAVVSQEQALAEQMAQRKAFKDDEHMTMYQEEFKGASGFAGTESKKRRGKAAPPGRCHSCNRAETPEWRRGPDGARTLCNACGLHYAKLTRKMGAHKASSLASNLKPKTSVESASPTSH